MLSDYFNLDNIKIMTKEEFNFYPKASEREAWENLSSELRKKLIENGEKY